MTDHRIMPLPILTVSLFCALLVASCRHVDPKTAVLGSVTCGPQKGDNKCSTCFKQSCCAEFQACANDAPCPCWFGGRLQLIRSADRLGICGPQNDAYKALSACLDARCAACSVEDALAHHALIGKPAPEIVAEPIGGEGPKTLKEALGKVVIVDFWATWCVPCKQSFPKYQEVADQYPGQVAILALSVDDPESAKPNDLLAFARDTHVRFSILWDKGHQTATKYGRPTALPSTFVVDRSGIIRHVHQGYGDLDRARMTAEIQSLVAEGGR